jgi:hypothetical protein
VAQHVLEHASDAQLQQLPVQLLRNTALQLLHAPRSQLVSSGAAAALLLKVLAAALQSAEADSASLEVRAKMHAVLLLQAVCGNVPGTAESASTAPAPVIDVTMTAATAAAVVQAARTATAGIEDGPQSSIGSAAQQLAQLKFGSAAGTGKAKKQMDKLLVKVEDEVREALTKAADSLPKTPQAFRLPFSEVHTWLQQLGQSAEGLAAAAVARLLQELLHHSYSYGLPRKQSWQMYQLLLELQQQPSWQQQGLTGLAAGTCGALIQQQREPAWYGIGADNVLQLLRHAAGGSNSSSAAAPRQLVPLDVYELLSTDSQSVVLAALVRLGKHADALQLVQQVPRGMQQLPALISLWSAQLQQAQQAGAAQATMSYSDDEGEPQQQQQSRSKQTARVRGTPVTLPVLQQALAVALQGSQLQLSGQVVALMQQAAAPDSSMPELFAEGQLEQYLLLLCIDSSSASFATATELVTACVDSSAHVQFDAQVVSAYATAAAASGAGNASQQLLRMAELPVLLQAAMQLASQQDAAPVQLLLCAVLGACSGGGITVNELLQQLSASDLQQLLSVSCRSAAGMCIAEQLVLMWLDSNRQLPLASALTFLDGCGQASPHLQPPAAAAALGLVAPAQLEAAAAAGGSGTGTSSQQHADMSIPADSSDEAAARAVASTQLVARVCQQLCQPGDLSAAAGSDAESSLDTSWVGRLSGPAAAVALLSCWAWQQQQQVDGSNTNTAPGPELLLLLYHASRQGSGSAKPRLAGLLLDLGLAAAARSGEWQEGEWGGGV